MIDLNDMAVFVRVIEEASFVGAARRLGLPKSTVSRRVADLEARLGVKLLHRTTRMVRATEAGTAYYERCAPLIAAAEEAERAVLRSQEAPSGLLRVTAPMLLGERLLAPVVFEYLRAWPDVRVALHLADEWVDLVEGGFDLAFRAGVLPDSSLVARRLGTATVCLVASPAYVSARGAPPSVASLREHACIVVGAGPGPHTWTLVDHDGPRHVPVNGPLVVNQVALALQAALAGLGVARLPRFLCEPELAAGRLVEVLADRPPAGGGVYAVLPGGRAPPTKVRVFLDLVNARLGGGPWDALGARMVEEL